MIWTDERVKELQDLQALLNEVRLLNSGSAVIERMQRCIAGAEKLLHTNFDKPRANFTEFLMDLARTERQALRDAASQEEAQ
jgi:hypothetical protein